MAISTTSYVPNFRIRMVGLKFGVIDTNTFTDFRQSIAEINIQRRIGDSAGFSITLYPTRLNPISTTPSQSWDYRFNPMDYVEISLGDPSKPNNLQVVMRGFISTIDRSLDISSGTPQEIITISGTDWEKIAQFPIYYLILRSGTPSLFEFEVLDAWYQIVKDLSSNSNVSLKPSEIIRALYDNSDAKLPSGFAGFFASVATQVASIILAGTSGAPGILQIPKLFLDAISDPLEITGVYQAINPVAQSQVTSVGPNTPIMEYFRMYQAAPWRELFFDDYENGQILVYKTTPWRDSEGKFLQENSLFPSNTTIGAANSLLITPKDYISFSLSRSDNEVFNAFFTYMLFNEPITKISKSTGGFLGDGNPTIIGGKKIGDITVPSDWRLFGVRFREERLIYMDYSNGTFSSQQVAASTIMSEPQRQLLLKNGATLTKLLASAMDHNELLTSGTITIAGNPNFHIGTYIRFQRNSSVTPSFFYLEGVQHTFRQPSGYSDGAYLTNLLVSRGEDILDSTSI